MSCDVGSSLFTEDELDSMYEIKLLNGGAQVTAGARVSASKPLELVVTGMDGAPEAASASVSVTDADGIEAASIVFATPAASMRGATAVKEITRELPAFTLPEALGEGYYTLRVSIRNPSGSVLSSSSTAILIFNGSIDEPDLAAYPGTPVAGEVSLLRLDGDYGDGIDPWVRWTINGVVKSVGHVSERADRLSWRAPAASGVYIVKAELFPFQPPAGLSVPPLAASEIRLPLSTASRPSSTYASTSPWSLLTFDGDFLDKGSRARASEPTSLGEPYLETYSSGFGYLLGKGGGVSSSSSLLPLDPADGSLAPFTAVVVIAREPGQSEQASGSLLTAYGLGGETLLAIGIDNGRVFLGSGGEKQVSTASLSASATRLAVYVAPGSEGTLVRFYIDEQPAGEGSIGAGLYGARPGACRVAGSDGYVAIYDELRVLAGPYPAFLIAEEAAKGEALLYASGFEGGILGDGLAIEGEGARLAEGSLSLGPGDRLLVGTPGMPPKGSSLSFTLVSGEAEVSIALEGGPPLILQADGGISLGTEETGLGVSTMDDSVFFAAAVQTKEGIRIYGRYDDSVLIATPPAEEARWTLTSGGKDPLVIADVSLSTFDPSLVAARKAGSIGSDLQNGRIALSRAQLATVKD